MIKQEHPEISCVLACYNAQSFLEESFLQVKNVLDNTVFAYEIIMVDDGSSDQTAAVIKKIQAQNANVRTVFHRKNYGRGKTVCDGFRVSKGQIIGFIDVDLDNPARYIFPLILNVFYGKADVCTAKRIYLLKFDFYLLLRWILSRGYSILVRFLLGVSLEDTETGCKFFSRDKIMPILRDVKSRGWFWDTEVMVRSYFARLKILEMPTIFIRNSHISTVDIVPDIFKYLVNLLRFQKEIKRLKKC